MASLGYSARVGIVVLLAAAVFYGLIFFLRNGLTEDRSYKIHVLFDDASGVAKGVDVTMAGVDIGKVDQVMLTPSLRADLTLSIRKDHPIPVGSRFVITVPALGDVGTLTVIPPKGSFAQAPSLHPGAVVEHGEQEPDITSALNNANQLMGEFHGTVQRLNKVLDQTSALIGDQGIQKGLHESLANLQMASRNGVLLTETMNRALNQDNAQVQQMLADTHNGTKVALGNIDATTADVRALTHDNRGSLNEIISNMRDTTAAIQGITSETNDMLKNGGISKNLSAITANMNETTKKLDAIAGNLQQLTSDASMQGDLKATVHNMRVTTEQMSYAVERVNHLIGVKGHEIGSTSTTATASVGSSAVSATVTTPSGRQKVLFYPQIDMIQNARDHRFRTDVTANVPVGTKGDFGQIGIFGLADKNRVDLEYGTLAPAGSLLDYRAGLHASKLGLGADWGLNRAQSISADLYDPNYGHLDVHGTLMLNQNIGLLLGGDDLTKRSSAVVGVEIRK